jgi:biotin carboxylase
MKATHRDRLVISYEFGSQSLFALHEAARELCDIIWLVDLGTAEMSQLARLMNRMGTVVDTAHRTGRQIIEELRVVAPSGLLSLHDTSMIAMSEIGAALDLDFHSVDVARCLSDKAHQRHALRRAGLPVPNWHALPPQPHQADVAELAREIGFPAVLKPRQGSGSRNTYRVRSQAELTELIREVDSTRPEPDGMLLEAYVEGPDRMVSRFEPFVSVESFILDGMVHHFAVTGRLPFAEPFREAGLVLPSDISHQDAVAATHVATSAISGLGVQHGVLHTELKFTPAGPRIIEVNGRIGGGIPELVTLAGSDSSILGLAMELALGVPHPVNVPQSFANVGWQRIVSPPVSAARIDTISGLDSLKDLPGVDSITINHADGETVDYRRGRRDFLFQVYGAAGDYDELESQLALVDRAVSITYANERGLPNGDA